MRIIYLFCVLIPLFVSCKGGKVEDIKGKLNNNVIEFESKTVFNSGEDGVNSYRIPSVVCAQDGSILVFCEARWESWRDKSRTDIVMKRSLDGGKTWSEMLNLTRGEKGAYMDPTPLLDKVTGRIYLFASYWPSNDHSGYSNKAVQMISDDNGMTWSIPEDVTNQLLPQHIYPVGFGPGTGIQMQGNLFQNRLILPMRVISDDKKQSGDVAVYSDDHGRTWKMGKTGSTGNEFQIVESEDNILLYNARVSGARMIARSVDGGNNWSQAIKDGYLPGVSKGCQASIFRVGETIYFSGIQGISETENFDERARLALYKSEDGGYTWNKGDLLYEKAAGYSCLGAMSNGSLVVVFEAADTMGFTRESIRGTNPPKRPTGWMRIDIIII